MRIPDETMVDPEDEEVSNKQNNTLGTSCKHELGVQLASNDIGRLVIIKW